MIPFVFPVVDNGRCWLKSCQMMAAPEGTKLNPPKKSGHQSHMCFEVGGNSLILERCQPEIRRSPGMVLKPL